MNCDLTGSGELTIHLKDNGCFQNRKTLDLVENISLALQVASANLTTITHKPTFSKKNNIGADKWY